jgi:hypothetical protein
MRVHKTTAIFAACALLAMPAVAGPGVVKGHDRAVHRHHAGRLAGCPVHKTAEGELVDCRGWRYRGGTIGWDNTCFHLDYLPSSFACSANGTGW